MSAAERFADTSVLLYLLSADTTKADRAEALLADGATISVQVLNEFASVASRKLGLSAAEIGAALEPIKAVCTVVPITLAVHERGLGVVKRYGFSIYDAMIVGAALEAGCKTLFTEDLQDGQTIEKTLHVKNPFRR
ncbi:MAG: PIN domain-containing protein [Burkholderiales bacterium]